MISNSQTRQISGLLINLLHLGPGSHNPALPRAERSLPSAASALRPGTPQTKGSAQERRRSGAARKERTWGATTQGGLNEPWISLSYHMMCCSCSGTHDSV